MSSASTIPLRITPIGVLGSRRALRLVERNLLVYRRSWLIFVSGFFEPFFYLLSIGVGLNKLVGALRLGNAVVAYAAYVAPGLLASSAMNGALFDATFNMFFRLKVAKTYDAILSTPLGPGDVALGELGWSLIRGSTYSGVFIVVMALFGYVLSPWAILCYPAAVLIGFAFAGVGLAATSFMRSWQDFDKVSLAIIPMFLFSATFYPLAVYPGWLQLVVRCTPLYQAVALERGLDAGELSLSLVGHSVYLAILGFAGLVVTARRLAALLLP
ncbi:MAG TPA: ABC transporter permease [Acidimicrobiales bacterium]|nr:ABC transporter permease [Acidimicrobiales bacterium]